MPERTERSTRPFPKRARLLQSAEFKSVFATGRWFNSKYFSIVVSRNSFADARLGLAVSKRKARLAVERNRLKRLIRESFRLNRSRLGGVDIVVIPRAYATGADAATLRGNLDVLWTRMEKTKPE